MARPHQPTVARSRPRPASLVLTLLVAAGSALGMFTCSASAQLHAARGHDAPSLTVPLPASIHSSINLSGEAGTDGISGPFFFGYTAQIGGDGGNGGTLTLLQGGLIELDNSESILVSGGWGGLGGVSWVGTPDNSEALDNGRNGISGDLLLNAPTTISLAGTAKIAGGPDYAGATSGTFSGGAVTLSLTDQSSVRDFQTVEFSANSVVSLAGSCQFILDSGSLSLLSGTSLTLSNSAFVSLGGLSVNGSSVHQLGGGVFAEQPTFVASQFLLEAGLFDMGNSPFKILAGSNVQILGGRVYLAGARSDTDTVQVVDSSVQIGQGAVGPDFNVSQRANSACIALLRSTLTFHAGDWKLGGALRVQTDSEFRVHAANFNTGFVSGSLDWQAGTVRVTDTGFALGAGTPLGDLLGGNTVSIGSDRRLAADQTIIIRPASLTLSDGGQFSASTVVGVGSAPLGFGQNYIAGTSTGSSLNFNTDTIAAARQANSTAAPYLNASINLAQGVLALVPTEQGTSPRPTLVVSGDITNGTLRVFNSPNASIAFDDLAGSAILKVEGAAGQSVVHANNATFGALQGTGGVALDGPFTINASANAVYSGSLTGPGSFVKSGPGTQEFNSPVANSYTGGTRVEGGTLFLNRAPGNTIIPGNATIASGGTLLFASGASHQIADTADVTVESGGTVDMAGQSETVRNAVISGTWNIDNANGTPGNLAATQSIFVAGGTLTGNLSGGPLTISTGTARVRGTVPSANVNLLSTLSVGGFVGSDQFTITGGFNLSSNTSTLKFTTGVATDPALIRALGSLSYPFIGSVVVKVDQFIPQRVGTAIKLIDFGTGSSTPQLSRYALAAPAAGSGRGVLTLNNRVLSYIVTRNACPADFDGSGTATVQDIFDFLSTWFAGTPGSDFNLSSQATVQDIFDFLAAWFSGCP